MAAAAAAAVAADAVTAAIRLPLGRPRRFFAERRLLDLLLMFAEDSSV